MYRRWFAPGKDRLGGIPTGFDIFVQFFDNICVYAWYLHLEQATDWNIFTKTRFAICHAHNTIGVQPSLDDRL